jgi:hypothetical protein
LNFLYTVNFLENDGISVVIRPQFRNKEMLYKKLIDKYYKVIDGVTCNETKVWHTLSLCSLLHKTHLFDDANGRICYFNLFPILLIEQGLFPVIVL